MHKKDPNETSIVEGSCHYIITTIICEQKNTLGRSNNRSGSVEEWICEPEGIPEGITRNGIQREKEF